MVVPCCNPHDTYLSSMFLYSPSQQYTVFLSILLCCTYLYISSPWQITLAHPDIPCVACPSKHWSSFAQLFSFSVSISPIPYIFHLFLNSIFTKIYLPWSACPSWPVSNLSYCTVWKTEPTLYFPVCTTVTPVKLSLSPHNRPINPRDKVLRQEVDGCRDDWPRDDRLMSLSNILLRPGCQVPLWIRDEGLWGNEIKRLLNSCKYLLEP